MKIRTAYQLAAALIAESAEAGSGDAAEFLIRTANSRIGRSELGTHGGVLWSSLREASAELSYFPEHAAMSLLCAQLADEYGPL